MNSPMIFSYFILFSMNDILLTQSTGILRNRDVSNAIIDNAIREAFVSAKRHRVKEVEYKIDARSDRQPSGFLNALFGGFFRSKTTATAAPSGILQNIFGTKIIFHDVNFYLHFVDNRVTTPFSLVRQNVSDDEISVLTNNLRITLEVELRRKTNESCSGYGLFTTLHFGSLVLKATRTNEAKFVFDFSYKDYLVWNHGAGVKIKWRRYGLDFPGNEADDLTREITPILPLLLHEHINRNPEFSRAIDNIIVNSFIILSGYPFDPLPKCTSQLAQNITNIVKQNVEMEKHSKKKFEKNPKTSSQKVAELTWNGSVFQSDSMGTPQG